MVERINNGQTLLAIIIRSTFSEPGIHFFTEDQDSQQIAFMKHPAGKVIDPHVHNAVQRTIDFTKETLFIRKGSIRVDFYDQEKQYLESRILSQGDVILLSAGGHGFEVMEDIEMIEVKQGPYAGDADKIRFKKM